MRESKNQKGQSLFELLVAVSAVSVFLIALIGAVVKSVNNSTFSRNKTLATRYSQEAVEWMRGERNVDWAAFYARASAGGSTWCLASLNWDAGGTCLDAQMVAGTKLKREAILRAIDSGRVEALVVVSWNAPDGVHESRTTEILTNWKND